MQDFYNNLQTGEKFDLLITLFLAIIALLNLILVIVRMIQYRNQNKLTNSLTTLSTHPYFSITELSIKYHVNKRGNKYEETITTDFDINNIGNSFADEVFTVFTISLENNTDNFVYSAYSNLNILSNGHSAHMSFEMPLEDHEELFRTLLSNEESFKSKDIPLSLLPLKIDLYYKNLHSIRFKTSLQCLLLSISSEPSSRHVSARVLQSSVSEVKLIDRNLDVFKTEIINESEFRKVKSFYTVPIVNEVHSKGGDI